MLKNEIVRLCVVLQSSTERYLSDVFVLVVKTRRWNVPYFNRLHDSCCGPECSWAHVTTQVLPDDIGQLMTYLPACKYIRFDKGRSFVLDVGT